MLDCIAGDDHEDGAKRSRNDQSDNAQHGREAEDRERAQRRAQHSEERVPEKEMGAARRIEGEQPRNGRADTHAEGDGEEVQERPFC